jgi:Glycosyltransferase family 87
VVNKALAWLTAKRIFIYAMALAVMTNLFAVGLYIHVPSFAETPGADFVQFYSAAIMSRVNPDKLYDSDAQKDIQKQFSQRARNGIYWPYLHAPFFTVLLIPLSAFSYVEAYWVWTAFTVFLSCLSVVMMIRLDSARRPPLKLGLAVMYAAPVLYWLIATGQTTAVALFLWTLGFVLIKQNQLYWSGFVLGVLSYRAQYLTVLLPLLAIRRMWAGILGVGTSCVLLVTVGGLMFSFRSYAAYIESVAQQSQRIVTLTQPLSHYVTLYGFFRSLLPRYWAVSGTSLTSLFLIYWLWRVWRKVVPPQSNAFDLQWAILMTTTLLLMHHGFIYDLILLTVPILLLYPYSAELSPYYKISLLLIYFIPYFLLIVPGRLPFNLTQPLLICMCFEIYRVFTKLPQTDDYTNRTSDEGILIKDG